MAVASVRTFGPGQVVVSRPESDLVARDTTARIDPARCVTAGGGDEFRGAVWVAVTGTREEVTSDGAKKMAERYGLGSVIDGGIERAHGPIPDDDGVVPPVAGQMASVRSAEDYLAKAAEMNVRKSGDRCVCFYLVRPLQVA